MKFACFTIFVCLNDDFSSFNNSTTEGETAKKRITNFEIKMSQFIAQMFQAGAVTECAAALLSFRYPSLILFSLEQKAPFAFCKAFLKHIFKRSTVSFFYVNLKRVIRWWTNVLPTLFDDKLPLNRKVDRR